MPAEVTNHLWQSTVFALAVGLFTVGFRRNRAEVRYWLWLAASFKFLVPLSLLIGFASHLKWAPAAPQVAAPAVSHAIVQLAVPFPESVPAPPIPAAGYDWTAFGISAVWLCGFLAVAAVPLRGWLQVRDALRAGTPVELACGVRIHSTPGLLNMVYCRPSFPRDATR